MRGVVVASEEHTVDAGARLLRAGGNAVDALVAAKFAAMITELPLTSLGGGGACIWGDARNGYRVLDCFAAAPGLAADSRGELDFLPVTVDFGQTSQVFHIGRGAAAVPGQLVGLLHLHRLAGRLPLRQVLAPAVTWARDGFALSPQIAMMAALIHPITSHTPSVARLFLPGGKLPAAEDRMANPELGDFLHALAEGDAPAQVARYWAALVEHFGATQGGLLTAADAAAYAPVEREPLAVPFGDYTVLTNPPPSAGGGLIGLGLRLAERFRIGGDAFLSAAHQIALARLLAMVSDFRQSVYDQLLRNDPAAISELVASGDLPAGAAADRRLGGESALGATTHVSVIDADGMAAAMTSSNGEGCGYALPGLGIHVNNFLGEEDINPGGFHRLAPGTRMSTMMAPTIVIARDRPCFALGSGGSNRIRSAILQALLNLLVYRLPPEQAVNAARLHVEGDKLWFEDVGLAAASAAALQAAWPAATRFTSRSMFFGGVNCAAVVDGLFCGAGDRRRGGVVVVAKD